MGIINKKALLCFLLLLCFFTTTACNDKAATGTNKNAADSGKTYASVMPKDTAEDDDYNTGSLNAKTAKKHIESIVKAQVSEYENMSIDSLTVLSLQGTDTSDDYTVRCYIELKGYPNASAAYETVTAFAKELAARLDAYSGSVGECSLAWTASSITGSGRITYKKINGALEFSTEDFDDNLNVNDNKS